MRIEVTEHNNVKHDDVLYVAGTVFEADDDVAAALIESGAAVAVEADAEPTFSERTYGELKDAAKALGLDTTGKKDDLKARVEAAEAEASAKEGAEAGSDGQQGSEGSTEGDSKTAE